MGTICRCCGGCGVRCDWIGRLPTREWDNSVPEGMGTTECMGEVMVSSTCTASDGSPHKNRCSPLGDFQRPGQACPGYLNLNNADACASPHRIDIDSFRTHASCAHACTCTVFQRPSSILWPTGTRPSHTWQADGGRDLTMLGGASIESRAVTVASQVMCNSLRAAEVEGQAVQEWCASAVTTEVSLQRYGR